MSWKERRLIAVLSMILLVLTLALIIVLAVRYRDKMDTEQAPQEDLTAGLVADQDSFNTLTYFNGETTLSFERDETGIWRWTADRALPLDDSVILDILDHLSAWNPQQTLTDADSLENSGVSEPTGSITATTASGSYTKLVFGKTTTDGSSDYVRLNDDESTVYIIDGALSDLMDIPVYDMCRLPNLPVLEESRIRSIVIRGAAQGEDSAGIITSLTAQQSDGYTTWRFEGANVSDLPEIRALLEDLTALTFEKCIDYNPSAEAAAICGFDAPAAILQVSYVTEGGAEQSLELTIGNRLPDQSGRYTRMGTESTLYLLVTDLLDPLMTIAANGLDG
jgi:hypothetical protein